MILAIDPGTLESGWCLVGEVGGALRIFNSGTSANPAVLEMIRDTGSAAPHVETLAIEMVASYGMPVGREVFETVVWIGRFLQVWRAPEEVRLIYRRDVKLELCGSARAKDGNIRQALIDRLGPVGLKKDPGPLYGVKAHAWSALAVAVTARAAA